jgi:general L-amino acid transport system permease protein
MNLLLRRLRADLFATPADGALSLGLIALISAAALGLVQWASQKAQWAVIQANSTLFAVGRYPEAQQWRLWLLTALLAAAAGVSWGLLRCHPRSDRDGELWPRNDRLVLGLLAAVVLWLPWAPALQSRWWLLAVLLGVSRWLAGRFGSQLSRPMLRLFPLVWPLLYLFGMVLISGGLGMMPVSPSQWGGLLLTLLTASFAILLCFPLGDLLALGRLFLGQNILGFLLPGGLAPDRIWRAAWVLTFFAAAYLAEAVRSGLAAVPKGQVEAARSLGLSYPQTLVRVILPQALRVALPAMVGQFISLLQDTTLLSLIGLLELLGVARTVMANPEFLGHNAEVYLTLALLFWSCCAALGLGSRALEKRLDPQTLSRSASRP